MKRVMIVVCLAVLAGCATTGGTEPRRAVETIRYETSPCFGACPVYVVTVSSDGSGTFDGKRFTAASGERSFAVMPTQFAEFRKRLQSYRPVGDRRIVPGEADCGSTITDQAGASIAWRGGGAAPATLSLYYGCTAPDLAAMKQVVRAAPGALPIAAFIGKH